MDKSGGIRVLILEKPLQSNFHNDHECQHEQSIISASLQDIEQDHVECGFPATESLQSREMCRKVRIIQSNNMSVKLKSLCTLSICLKLE